MLITRRQFAAGSLAAPAILKSGQAFAAGRPLTVASLLGEDKPETKIWRRVTEKLNASAPGRFDLRVAVVYALNALAGLLMCMGYLAWGVRWSHRLQWLAPAGRIALSNYLLQSLLCTLLFHGYGLGLFEQMGRAWQVVFAIVLFAAQVVASQLWLKHFRFGPLEWLWRAFTYMQWPPLRRGRPATA